jgi:hypothetical protein
MYYYLALVLPYSIVKMKEKFKKNLILVNIEINVLKPNIPSPLSLCEYVQVWVQRTVCHGRGALDR